MKEVNHEKKEKSDASPKTEYGEISGNLVHIALHHRFPGFYDRANVHFALLFLL